MAGAIEDVENAEVPDPTQSDDQPQGNIKEEISDMAPECLIKHPLQNKWTLWYLENDRTKSWEEMLNEITSFGTVEDFWSIYNYIKQPTEIKQHSDYSLFKKDIRPMWEDDANKAGGRWMISLPKTSRRTDLDTIWLDVILSLIGESFVNADEVNGAVLNARTRGDKIAVWTRDGTNKQAILEIGNKLKDCLHLQDGALVYQLHKDAMAKGGSSTKTTFVL